MVGMNGMGGMGRSMGMGGGGMSGGMSFGTKKPGFGQSYPGSQKWGGGMNGKAASRGQRGGRPFRGGRRWKKREEYFRVYCTKIQVFAVQRSNLFNYIFLLIPYTY